MIFGIDFTNEPLGADWIQSKLAFYLSLGFASLSFLISCIHIVQHLLHYSMPGIQIYVIRILVICPVYAISSAFALGLGEYGAYAEIARDVYEAFVIYSFFNLILEYSGGETDCIYQIENEPQLKWPCPLCFLKPRPRDARLMRFCLRGVLQFVIIKPIVAVMDIIMIATGNKTKLGYEIFVFIVYNISYAWALYCMFVFYQAIKKLIKKFRPILKFASVKAIVFATYYQSLAVQASSMSPENTVRWNDFILCIEMVFFSGLLMIAFPTSEFQGGIPDSKFIENVRSVLSVHDVMQDVYHNFIPVYHDYTLQRSESEAPEVVRMKTYLAGNLDSVAIEMSRRYRGRNKRLAFNSLLRGSTPISARLRGTNRPFSRLRTLSENSSDVSDSEPYYDEESLESYGSSHDSLDESSDSTMELCKPPQDQLQKMPRILPQFNGQLTGKPKYLMLNPPNSKDEYISDGNDDLESNKPFKRPLTKQPQVKTLPGHHFLPHKDRKQTILKQDEMIDYDKPQNLKTIPLLSPVEQDIMERRFNAMATHGIGLVVTKNGIEIRAADYHPTEEEGVVNEGFMGIDDSSHHSKYDRQAAVTSPLSQSVHNPAAANLPRLPKKSSSKKKGTPEKIVPPPNDTSSESIPPPILPFPAAVSKPLPTLPPLRPPPSDRSPAQSQPEISNYPAAEVNHESEAWGWGDFVDHTEGFAEFPRGSPSQERSEDISTTDDPFIDSHQIIQGCLRDIVSVVELLNQEDSSTEVDIITSASSQRSSPAYVMVEEHSIERGSSSESDHQDANAEVQPLHSEVLSGTVGHPSDGDPQSTSSETNQFSNNQTEESTPTLDDQHVDPTDDLENFIFPTFDEEKEGIESTELALDDTYVNSVVIKDSPDSTSSSDPPPDL